MAGVEFEPDAPPAPPAPTLEPPPPAPSPDPATSSVGNGAGTTEAPPKRSHQRRVALEWTLLIAASLAVALLARGFLVQAFFIPSESMVPTLHKNDRVLVNKLSYRLHDVHRGDVVVFEAPPGAGTTTVKDLIKRVIGLSGETIEGKGGEIYIDGKPLDEPYLPPNVRSKDFAPEKVPPERYWVLGDNRQDSRDSTYFKSIARSSIIGRAFVRIWPLGDLGFI
jgi:signal peptidase I